MALLIRKRLTYANVAATLAVFIALGSTGVAAPVADGVHTAANSLQQALGLSKKASKSAKKALATARRADKNAKAALAKGGPPGPPGPKGDTATNAANSDKLDNLDSLDFAPSSLFGGGRSGGDSPGTTGSECYLGDVWLAAENFARRNTHFADGAVLPISGNTALFSLLGTTYGGDGVTTFALPDLRDAAPNSTGQAPVSYVICVNGLFPSQP